MVFYKSEPFIVKSFESFVTKNDLIESSKLCNYNEQYLMDLKNKSQDEKELFAWHMGLNMDELNQLFDDHLFDFDKVKEKTIKLKEGER